MTESVEQRVCVKFCFKLGKTATEANDMIKLAFGEDAMSRARVFEWFRRFKEGHQSCESEPRSGRPSTSRNEGMIAQVRTVVRSDRRLTVRELAEECGISVGSCDAILTQDLQMRRIAAKFVPRLLTEDQQEHRIAIASELVDRAREHNDFMTKIITGDESWVYGYDPETKQQSSQWTSPSSPRPKKARQVRSNVKVMLLAFFDSKGIVHYEYAPKGQTINKEFYVEVLKRLREAVRRKRPELWANGDWELHQDGAPAHTSHLVQQFLAKRGIPLVPQPPYSPDMAPCDFFLFPRLKNALKGRRFEDVELIKQNVTRELKSITLSEFQKCYEQWQHRWVKCVVAEGKYFEGD